MISAFIEEIDRIGAHARVKEIFFLSSRSGASLAAVAREKFFDCWAGYYLEEMPEHTLLFKTESGKIIGYLTGCLNSAAARPLYGSCFYYSDFDVDSSSFSDTRTSSISSRSNVLSVSYVNYSYYSCGMANLC